MRGQCVPQNRRLMWLPRRRGKDVLRPLESWLIKHILGEVEILRAGLGENIDAPGSTAHDLLQCLRAADVDDIDGCPDDLGECDGASGRFGLDTWRTARGVVFGIRLALVQEALAQKLGCLAIL